MRVIATPFQLSKFTTLPRLLSDMGLKGRGDIPGRCVAVCVVPRQIDKRKAEEKENTCRCRYGLRYV